MAVVDKSEDKEAIKQANADNKAAEDQFLKEITQGADKVVQTEEDPKEGEEGAEDEGQEEGSEEEAAEGEEQGEESAEEGAEGEKTEGEEEKSPMQKRIDELTKQNKKLVSENARLKNSEPETASKDPEIQKLERMSVDELKSLRREVIVKQRTEQNEEKLRRWVDLEEKIDSTIQSYPQRFEKAQLSEYRKAIDLTVEEFGEKWTDPAQTRIFEKAKSIFQRSAALQNDLNGQATAWELAVDWYKEISKLSVKAEKSDELRRDNNKLRKKVVLDTAVKKGAETSNENTRLFKRAKGGDKRAELDWVSKELGL